MNEVPLAQKDIVTGTLELFAFLMLDDSGRTILKRSLPVEVVEFPISVRFAKIEPVPLLAKYKFAFTEPLLNQILS